MAHVRLAAKIEGGEELLKELQKLGINVRKTVAGAATLGAQVLAQNADELAPESSHRGKRIGVAVTARERDHVTVSIGPRKKFWYLRFFETGAAPHEIHGKPYLRFFGPNGPIEVKSVHHPGMAARPFLRPAVDAHGNDAIQVTGEAFRAAVEEARIAAEGGDDE